MARKKDKELTKDQREKHFKDVRGQVIKEEDMVVHSRWNGQNIGIVKKCRMGPYGHGQVVIVNVKPFPGEEYRVNDLQKVMVVNELRGLV